MIAGIRKAGKIGKARTRELRKVMRKIEEGKRAHRPKAVSLRWVKSHIVIKGKKEEDQKVKLGADKEDSTF